MSSSQRRYPPPGRGGGGGGGGNANVRSQQHGHGRGNNNHHQHHHNHNPSSSPPRRSYDYRAGKNNQASGSRISGSSSSTHYPPPRRASPPPLSSTYTNIHRGGGGGGERRGGYEANSPPSFYGGDRGASPTYRNRNRSSRSPFARGGATNHAPAVRSRSPLTKRYPSPLTKIYPLHPEEDRRRRPSPGPPPHQRPSAAASSADRNGSRGGSGGARGGGAGGQRNLEDHHRSRSSQRTGGGEGGGGSGNQSVTAQKLSRREQRAAAEHKRRVSALKRLGPKLSVTDRLWRGGRGENKNNSKGENSGAGGKKADHHHHRNGRASDKKQRKDPKSDDHANGGAGDGSNGTGNNSAMQITIRADEENREVNDDELAKEEGAFGKHSVKLECPHCHVKCVTFKEYTIHCQSDAHNKTMKQLKNQLHLTLGRMRTKQRTQQKEIERLLKEKQKDEDLEDVGEGGEKEDEESGGGGKPKKNAPIYCRVCKLVFHQKRSEHNSSEMHKLINKFLNPTCATCNTKFFSPMAYEKHISSLAHIKRKKYHSDVDLQKVVEDTEEDFGSDCDQGEFDMDNFMTLDEVGEVEDELEETGGKEQDENKAEDTEKDNKAPSADTDKDIKSESEQKEGDKEKTGESGESVSAPTEGDSKPVVEEAPKPKLEIKIEPDTPYGEAYVKRVEMFYCDLCHKYLPRVDPAKSDEALESHCKSTYHQNAYVKAKQEEFEKQQSGQEEKLDEEKNGNVDDTDDADQSSVVAPVERDEILLGTQNFDDEDQLDYEAE